MFLRETISSSGVFGVVRLGFIPSIQQRVAVKIFSEKLTETEILAETKIALEKSGHPHFDYVFGITEPNKLLMEYIDSETLSEIVKNNPVVYNIRKGSPKHKRYNTYHRCLAHELRNIPDSSVTCHSDIYSLGYNFRVIAQHVRSEKLTVISTTMLAEKPTD